MDQEGGINNQGSCRKGFIKDAVKISTDRRLQAGNPGSRVLLAQHPIEKGVMRSCLSEGAAEGRVSKDIVLPLSNMQSMSMCCKSWKALHHITECPIEFNIHWARCIFQYMRTKVRRNPESKVHC